MNEAESKLWKPELNGYSDDILPYYKEIIVKMPEHSKLVEVGTFHGRSAVFMAEEIEKLNKNVDFYTIDVWDMRPACLRDSKAIFLQGYSLEVAKTFSDESLDFVFIDATHTYEAVKDDIKTWLPKVKKGGIIAGHDYYDYDFPKEASCPGVRKAVDECFSQEQIKHPARTVWEVTKTS
jgi:predicted O-methyltransferase YrrM